MIHKQVQENIQENILKNIPTFISMIVFAFTLSSYCISLNVKINTLDNKLTALEVQEAKHEVKMQKLSDDNQQQIINATQFKTEMLAIKETLADIKSSLKTIAENYKK